MAKVGLTGNLQTMSLADLLQWASRGSKTGTMVLRDDSLSKKIYFRNGIVIGSFTNDPAEYLGQILISEGIITEQHLKDAIDQQLRTRVMLGRILVREGLVTEERVSEILRRKAEETIYSLFLWTQADFEFIEDDLPPGEQVTVDINVEHVLMEGLRRFDKSKVIRQTFPTNDVVLDRTEQPLPTEIAAKRFPLRLYNLVDGRRSLADIILEAHSSEFNVCQVMHALVQRGFLSVSQPGEAPRADAPSNSARATVEMIAAARELIKMDDAEAAIVLLEKAQSRVGKNAEVNALIQVAERYFVEKAYRHFLPPKKIPVLKKSLESLVDQNLSPEEMFLVSRVNGCWDLQAIMTISPLREIDALRALKKLREKGVIELVDAQAKSA